MELGPEPQRPARTLGGPTGDWLNLQAPIPGLGETWEMHGTSSLGSGGGCLGTPGTERSTLFTTARMHIQYIHIYRKPSDRRGGGTPLSLGPWGKGKKKVRLHRSLPRSLACLRYPRVPVDTRMWDKGALKMQSACTGDPGPVA